VLDEMTAHLDALCLDALDPPRLARFWAGLLGRELVVDRLDGVELLPGDDGGLRMRFLASSRPKVGLDRMHLDLTSTSPSDQEQTVATAVALGATHLDVGQRPEEGHVVLADPEGNEFCVTEPGNRFLAGCGLVGALSCDGAPEVGYFWSEALGWPLVWDQDEETAIQSPEGGPKITWGGPPVRPKAGRNRLHLDLVPPPGVDHVAEADRLVSLGAGRVDPGQGGLGRIPLVDPGGNELCVLAAR